MLKNTLFSQLIIGSLVLFTLVSLQTNYVLNQASLNHLNTISNVQYGSFVGGTLWDEAEAIAVDNQGQIVIGGHTQSLVFPGEATNFFHKSGHAVEAFVSKFNADGTDLAYTLVITSDVEDFTTDVAVNDSGEVYAIGHTDSTNFPTTAGAFDTDPNGGFDVFILKLDSAGNVIYSTLLGGNDNDYGSSIAIDDAGNVYVTGSTWATDFPVTDGAYDTSHNGQRDIFIAKLNPDGSKLLYSTFIGGAGQEQAEALVFNPPSQVYITGWTRSDDFPTTAQAYQPTYSDNFEAFALKMDLVNTPNLVYATYLGGTSEDRGFGLALGANGDLFITGLTTSTDFPISATPFDDSYNGGTCDFFPCPDVFVTKLNQTGSSLIYSTYLGGSGWDSSPAIVVDEFEIAYLTGKTSSTDFPTTSNALDTTLDGDDDAFIARLSTDGDSLHYGSYLGGSDTDKGADLLFDATSSRLYLAGRTLSGDFPTSEGAYDVRLNGDYDAFASIIVLPTLVVSGTATPTPTITITSSPTVTPTATATTTPTATSTSTGTVTTTPTATVTTTATSGPTPTPTPTPTSEPLDEWLYLPLIKRSN